MGNDKNCRLDFSVMHRNDGVVLVDDKVRRAMISLLIRTSKEDDPIREDRIRMV